MVAPRTIILTRTHALLCDEDPCCAHTLAAQRAVSADDGAPVLLKLDSVPLEELAVRPAPVSGKQAAGLQTTYKERPDEMTLEIKGRWAEAFLTKTWRLRSMPGAGDAPLVTIKEAIARAILRERERFIQGW